jgi:hypothetical protein
MSPSVQLRRALRKDRLVVYGLSLAALIGVLMLAGGASDRVGRAEDRAAARGAAIFFSGSVHGFLGVCGCPSFPMGGLDRRAGYLEIFRKEERGIATLLLDSGNLFDEPGAAGDVRTRALIRGMGHLGYEAAGVGERELALGAEHFLGLTGDAPFPFISANLVIEGSRQPWLSDHLIREPAGFPILVTSVTGEFDVPRVELEDGRAVVVADPAESVARVLDAHGTEDTFVVVLSALPLEEARVLARRVSDIDLIVGARGLRHTIDPIREGRTQILYCGDEGKYFGRVLVFDDAQASGRFEVRGTLVALDDRVPREPDMEAYVVESQAEASEAERLQRSIDDVHRTEADRSNVAVGYLGSGSCTACHADIVAEWSQTAHAHAWQTLRRAEKVQLGSVRNSCIPCHVTGYGEPGGFVDEETTPHLVDVGCESCHGPGAAHVAQPELEYGAVTLANCTTCHTPEMDPDFNYYRDVQLVSHQD